MRKVRQTLFVVQKSNPFSLSLSAMISDLKARPNVFPVVQEHCFLAFSASSQRSMLCLCLVSPNRGSGNHFLKSTMKLREGTSRSAGATALISFLLFRQQFLAKNAAKVVHIRARVVDFGYGLVC